MADWFDAQGNPLTYDPNEGNRDEYGNLHGLGSIFHYAQPGDPNAFYSDDPNDRVTSSLDAYHRGDSPYGVSYASTQGGIDIRPGTNVDNVRQQLRAMGGDLYDETDLNDVLRNVGYSNQGATLGQMLAAAEAKYAERARARGADTSGNDGSGSTWSFAGAGYPGAPQSIQPFQFDASKVGTSDAFKFRFDKAMEAINRHGAAKGTYFSPQTTDALQAEASGLAAQEYDSEWNRQFDAHTWNEGNRYSSQRTNRMDDFGIYDTNRNFDRRVFESDRAYDRGVFLDDRGFNYRLDRDRVDDTWRFVDYGYNAARR